MPCPRRVHSHGYVNLFEACKNLIGSRCVHVYPGPGSIWIMDGAKVHCHPDIVNYLRAAGIVVIFLPACCPFCNPVEIFFWGGSSRGSRVVITRRASSMQDLGAFVLSQIVHYSDNDMSKLLNHCAYLGVKQFNIDKNFQQAVCFLPD